MWKYHYGRICSLCTHVEYSDTIVNNSIICGSSYSGCSCYIVPAFTRSSVVHSDNHKIISASAVVSFHVRTPVQHNIVCNDQAGIDLVGAQFWHCVTKSLHLDAEQGGNFPKLVSTALIAFTAVQCAQLLYSSGCRDSVRKNSFKH